MRGAGAERVIWGLMQALPALLAGAAAALFFGDLLVSYYRRPRPHIAAYAAGMGCFALACWALFAGVFWGWTSASYRLFFLFGGIVNIPLLALGSMFLVVGRRSGHLMLMLLLPFFAISVPMAIGTPFDAGPLPAAGVPAGRDLWLEMFGPRLWAAIGGGAGATILILLALVSAARFWRSNRRVVWGSLCIAAGTLAAAGGGTVLALGEQASFGMSLLATVILIWAGYRIASGARSPAGSGEGGSGALAGRAPVRVE